ncbi:hypothetical protein PV328_010995 [Microctonus aethiopoides]|uniref:Serpin domain-containing protein n=1 Tax=Microctonus aethiopoides TaxID=144406 RepID=A0AA39FJ92_9HYME|nr:hypothetical protein PV328_010995 [Microctonus aethiopoides]
MNYHILLFSSVITFMTLSINSMAVSENEAALNADISSINNFGIEFNKVVSKEKSSNYICSPFSVSMVLSMATCGAEGKTKSELQQNLHLSTDDTVMKNGCQTLIDTINDIQGVELAVVNKIFTTTGFEMKDTFKEATKTYFRSESESLDFSKAEQSAEAINNWAAANTKDRIKDIVKPDDVKSAVMIMANAVYFKGKWAKKFNPNLTRPLPFHVSETTTKNVDMMYRNGDYNWGVINDLNAKYIELPYENENISMFIIVPDEFNGLAKIEENHDKINYTELSNGRKTEVELTMPKFKIESEFDLKSTLQKLNIKDMFEDTANFHGINEDAALKVSKVIQKAFIEVNEEGSEAAAVTGLQIVPASAPIFLNHIIVDKPFVCAIVIKKIKVAIFNARIVNPTSTI